MKMIKGGRMIPDPLSLGAMAASRGWISMAEVVASTRSTVARVERVESILEAGLDLVTPWGGTRNIYSCETPVTVGPLSSLLLEGSNQLGKCKQSHILSFTFIV